MGEGEKTRHFPILDLGGGGGGSRFSIYFVQDCSPQELPVFSAQVSSFT